MSHKVRLIVVTFNSERDIVECLNTLLSQRGVSVEVTVVDNSSTDSTVSQIESQFRDVRLIRNNVNKGYAGAVNQAYDGDSSEYIAIINADTSSDSSWLTTAIEQLERNMNAGICQPKIALYDKRWLLNSRGNEANFLFFSWPAGYGSVDSGGSVISQQIACPSGCAMVCRKECFVQLGGFDDSYFMYGEDMDLGLRAFLMGWNVIYSPSSTVYHKYTFRETAAKYFLLERNRMTSLIKMYGIITLAFIFPAFLVAELGVLTKAFHEGWVRSKLASYGAVLRNLPSALRSRAEVQKNRRMSDHDLLMILKGGLEFEELRDFKFMRLGNHFLDRYRDFLIDLRI